MKRRRVTIAWVVVVAGSCDVFTAPDEDMTAPALLVTAEQTFADILEDVDGARLSVTKPGSTPRDTLVKPISTPEGIRIRAVLRPDEGEPGTEIEVVLSGSDTLVSWRKIELFRGSTVLDPVNGWPQSAEIELVPVATLDLGPGWVLDWRATVTLSTLTPIVFLDGRTRRTDEIVWASLDPTIVAVDDGRAVALTPGSTGIVGTWYEQTDTLPVEVRPTGTIVVADSMPQYFFGPSDVVVDSISVDNGPSGDVGQVSASLTASSPWLSATLTDATPPSKLIVQIDGAAVPEGGSVGEVQLSSTREGVNDLVVQVHARRDPSTGVEVKRWSPFCLIGDSLQTPQPGVVGCVDLEARSWIEGNVRRVTVEVQNLHGSLGGELDTAPQFDLYSFGVGQTGALRFTTPVHLLDVRRRGSVRVVGSPQWVKVNYRGELRLEAGSNTAIVGCAPSQGAGNLFITCDPEGSTGSIRADFEVANTIFSFADLDVLMRVLVPGQFVFCGSYPGSPCMVR